MIEDGTDGKVLGGERCIRCEKRNEDLGRWDALVRELKRRGYTKANRSALLRYAVRQLDLDDIPPPPPSGDLDDVRGVGRAACPKCNHCFEYAVGYRKCPECGKEF